VCFRLIGKNTGHNKPLGFEKEVGYSQRFVWKKNIETKQERPSPHLFSLSLASAPRLVVVPTLSKMIYTQEPDGLALEQKKRSTGTKISQSKQNRQLTASFYKRVGFHRLFDWFFCRQVKKAILENESANFDKQKKKDNFLHTPNHQSTSNKHVCIVLRDITRCASFW